MVYYEQNGLQIRDMEPADVQIFVDGERAQGWQGASPEKLDSRLADRDAGKCVELTAEMNGEPAGYVALYWNASAGPFAGKNIPVIVDFNVLVKFRRNGIGSKLMDVCEQLAKQKAGEVCLSVGMYTDYGNAQRMYVKRGYIPDGSGLWWQGKICEPYEDCCNDDDLELHFSKKLS